jgi:hypothetical protein
MLVGHRRKQGPVHKLGQVRMQGQVRMLGQVRIGEQQRRQPQERTKQQSTKKNKKIIKFLNFCCQPKNNHFISCLDLERTLRSYKIFSLS